MFQTRPRRLRTSYRGVPPPSVEPFTNCTDTDDGGAEPRSLKTRSPVQRVCSESGAGGRRSSVDLSHGPRRPAGETPSANPSPPRNHFQANAACPTPGVHVIDAESGRMLRATERRPAPVVFGCTSSKPVPAQCPRHLVNLPSSSPSNKRYIVPPLRQDVAVGWRRRLLLLLMLAILQRGLTGDGHHK